MLKMQFILLIASLILVKAEDLKQEPKYSKENELKISAVLKHLNENPNTNYEYKEGRIVNVKQQSNILELTTDVDVTCKRNYPGIPCTDTTLRCISFFRDESPTFDYKLLSASCAPKVEYSSESNSESVILTPSQEEPKIEFSHEAVYSQQDVDFVAIKKDGPRNTEPCLGCPSDLNLDADGVNSLVDTALRHVETERNERHTLVKVLRLQQQVVAGIKYILLVEIAPTECPKNADSQSCPIDTHKNSLICEIIYIEQPWLSKGKNIIRNNCTTSQEFAAKVDKPDLQKEMKKVVSEESKYDFMSELESQIIPDKPKTEQTTANHINRKSFGQQKLAILNEIEETADVKNGYTPNFIVNQEISNDIPEAQLTTRDSETTSEGNAEIVRKYMEDANSVSSVSSKSSESSESSESSSENKVRLVKRGTDDDSSDSSKSSKSSKSNESSKSNKSSKSNESSNSSDDSDTESKGRRTQMEKETGRLSEENKISSSEQRGQLKRKRKSNNNSDSSDSSNSSDDSDDRKNKKHRKKDDDRKNKKNGKKDDSSSNSSDSDDDDDKDKKKEPLRDDSSSTTERDHSSSTTERGHSSSTTEHDDNNNNVQPRKRRNIEDMTGEEDILVRKFSKMILKNLGNSETKVRVLSLKNKLEFDGIYYTMKFYLENKFSIELCTAIVHVDKDYSDPSLVKTRCKLKRNRRGSPGGIVEVPKDRPEVKKYLNDGLLYLDSQSSHSNRLKVQEILSVSSQVVAGSLWRIDAKVILSDCEKGIGTDTEKCGELKGAEGRICHFKIWDRPWLPSGRKTEINCENEEKSYSFRQRRSLQELNDSIPGYDEVEMALFSGFVKKYKKSYLNKQEYNYRLSVFRDNLDIIRMLNKFEQGTAIYSITKFADLTGSEFSRMHGLRTDLYNENDIPFPEAVIPDIELPTEFDWRQKSAVTKIKDQADCGSCWAFSTTGNVEGQYAIKYKKLVEFSEQELVDCDKLDEGCNGGLMDNAYRAIEKLGGLETEQDYPYDAEDEKCHFSKNKTRVKLSGALNISHDETDMAKWLVQNGPIAIAINANAMQFYAGGISHPWKSLCNPKDLDHGVLIVGYGVHTYPKFNKTLPFWIVKNSWGESWGEQGYYRVYRGDGTCGLNQTPSSAVVA